MSLSFEASRQGFDDLWRSMTIRPERAQVVHNTALAIFANKARYKSVSEQTGVPWYFIGCVHERESSLNFRTHLHNGDPLSSRTYHVPAGRPVAGNPPFTWEESAVDALKYEGLDKVTDWSITRVLYQFEAYNGWGYRGSGINSPYVWAGTNQYARGKYVADHKLDVNFVDPQLGCAAMLKALMALDNTILVEKPVVAAPQKPAVPATAPQVGWLAALLNALGSLFKRK